MDNLIDFDIEAERAAVIARLTELVYVHAASDDLKPFFTGRHDMTLRIAVDALYRAGKRLDITVCDV